MVFLSIQITLSGVYSFLSKKTEEVQKEEERALDNKLVWFIVIDVVFIIWYIAFPFL